MKIILSCNDNPEYSNYWPVVRWQWRFLGYEPILFHVSERSVFSHDPLVRVIKPSPGISDIKQSQIARIYGCLSFPDEACVTADIDCILLQKDYLRDKWNQHNPDGKCMLAYSHAGYNDARRIGMQFIGGLGRNWQKVLQCDSSISWSEFLEKFPDDKYDVWSTDEIVLGNMLYESMDVRTIYLPRDCEPEWLFNKWIRRYSDRIYRQHNMRYDEEKLRSGYYVDITCGEYSKWIEKIKEIWEKVYKTQLLADRLSIKMS